MPYNEALGTTLIERSFRERIILVGVTLPPDTAEDTEASLDELGRQYDELGRLYLRWCREGRKFYLSPLEVKLASHILGAEARGFILGPAVAYSLGRGFVPARKPGSAVPKTAAYSYVSVVDGQPMRHATWAECEARVKGQSGARFKKASSAADEGEILRSWNVDPAALGEPGNSLREVLAAVVDGRVGPQREARSAFFRAACGDDHACPLGK